MGPFYVDVDICSKLVGVQNLHLNDNKTKKPL